jgi:hypothetical protein
MLEAIWSMMLAVTTGVAMTVPLVKMRRNRLLREEAERRHQKLKQWAQAHDWQAFEGIDLRYIDDAERVSGLTGEPRDWDIHDESPAGRNGSVPTVPKRWVYGTILMRQVAAGHLRVIGCWREGEASHHVFAALRTDGVFSPYTLDALGRGRFHEEGTPPLLDDGPAIRAVFVDLHRPARLRFLDNTIFLYTPGWLTGDMAEKLAERLFGLHRRLPRRPDLGPLR